jgi:SAM-dependent methyltransferase
VTGDLDAITRETGEAYDLVGPRYLELFRDELDTRPYDRELLDRFARYFEPGAVVYDMGCGPCGHISRYLQDSRLRIVGIDISERCVALAAEWNPGMEFQVMDMVDPVLDDESVDGIVAYYSILHTPKKYMNRLFRGFMRVLKPAGKVLVVVKGGSEEGYVSEFLDSPARVYFSHFTRDEIETYLDTAGFRILYSHVRESYADEIQVPRIYTIGGKN